MFDYRIILICLMVVMLLCLISSYQSDPTIAENKTEIDSSSSITNPNISSQIFINNDTYKKMVDIVTNYSMMATDQNEKMILIYLSTFHLFDMNYPYLSIKDLDEKTAKYPYYPNDTQFPEGNMHHNIQKAIITHITLQITNSERQLVHDKVKDRVIIDIYLYNLFTGIGIM